MSNFSYINNVKGLPNQMVPLSKKLSKNGKPSSWAKESMDFFDAISGFQTRERSQDLKYYQIFNGEYDFKDYEYTKPFAEQFGLIMSKPRHYSIVSVPINQLLGEAKQMPLNFICKAEGQHSKNAYNRTKKALVMDYIKMEITNELRAQGHNVEDPEVLTQMQPPEIEEYMAKSYQDIIEQASNYILKYQIKKEDLKNKTLLGFKDGLCVGKEFYISTIVNNTPLLDNVNPLFAFYDMGVDTDYVEDGEYAGMRIPMTSSQIIYNFGPSLSMDQVKSIMEYTQSSNRKLGFLNPKKGINSLEFDTNQDRVFSYRDEFMPLGISMDGLVDAAFRGQSTDIMQLDRIPVVIAYWKSKRKVGWLNYIDEDGMDQVMLVDENYREDKELGEWIEWEWINQVWEGIKIGTDIYLNIRPLNYQHLSPDNLYDCKLPITGGLYNCRNTKPVSLLKEMLPYQEFYDIYMTKLEQDFNSEMGKVLLMNARMVPNTKGWDVDKWMWYLKEFKIAWVNDSVENMGGSPSSFNQMTQLDLSLADDIQGRIQVLEYLKAQCNYIAGITPERLGNTQQTETLGGIERSVRQSVAQSEVHFQRHFSIVQRALTAHLQTCQIAYREGKQLNMILDDASNMMLQIEGGLLELEKVGVFVTDSSEDYRVLNAVRSLAQPAMQNGMDLSEVALMETTDSISEVKGLLKKAKAERLAKEQQEYELQQEAIKTAQATEMEKLNREDVNRQLDREHETNLEIIRALGFNQDDDIDRDLIPDVLEEGKLALEQSRFAYETSLGAMQEKREGMKILLEKDKINKEHQIKKKELNLKEKEIKVKDEDSKRKVKIARMNKNKYSK